MGGSSETETEWKGCGAVQYVLYNESSELPCLKVQNVIYKKMRQIYRYLRQVSMFSLPAFSQDSEHMLSPLSVTSGFPAGFPPGEASLE